MNEIKINDTVVFTERKGYRERKITANVNDVSGYILAVSTEEGEPFLINKFDVDEIIPQENNDDNGAGTSDRLINESDIIISLSRKEVKPEDIKITVKKNKFRNSAKNLFLSLDDSVRGVNLDCRA
jgi:hypothetical protein